MTVPSIVIGAAVVMIGCEMRYPGRNWPKVAGWWMRAAVFNGVQCGIAYLSGITWDRWMKEYRLWSLDELGVTLSTVIGYVVITFLYYWWHRWRHQSGLLWRVFHQFHHSPQRIEVITSFYKHPLEILANGILSSSILYLLVGVSPEAAAYAVLLTGVAELFYHWNVPTPYWLGFLIQRPESHCVHHQEGLHAYNYGDLPLWDMMFGTFRNPRNWQARCGFGDDEHKLATMLSCVDITAGEQEKSHQS